MKLAEALLLRADLQKKLASLKARIGQFTRVQEGDAPAEDPNALISEALIVTRDRTHQGTLHDQTRTVCSFL